MDKELRTNDSATNAPDAIKKLADKMLKVHNCPGILSREASGYHLYIPCPECLETHGKRELADPKYSINLSMIAGVGEDFAAVEVSPFNPASIEQRDTQRHKQEFGSSICMRTRSSREPHRFSWGDLLAYATVTERHPDIMTQANLSGGTGSAEKEAFWEDDPVSGKPCPPPAGEVVPLGDLPPEHPAVAYLTQRGYDPEKLAEQFRCGFCVKEYPRGQKEIFYRRLPGGWMDTPQHRIVFHSLIGGVPMTWQARVIEKQTDFFKFMLHPYAGGYFPTTDERQVRRSIEGQGHAGTIELTPDGKGGIWGFVWSRTHVRSSPTSNVWMPVTPFDAEKDGVLIFKPSKYRTAKHSTRHMMGWDAALARADKDPEMYKWVVLCEGPLDAARVGPGGVALIGSSISPDNAAKIAKSFHIAFSGFDADKAGKQATTKINKTLMRSQQRSPLLQGVIPMSIPSGKDLGDLSEEQFQQLLKRTIKKFKRGM